MVRPKFKGIKISINNNSVRLSLREDGRSFYKTYFHVDEEIDFENRKELLDYLKDYLKRKLLIVH